MTSPVSDLIRDLGDPDEAVRRYAAEDLADLGDPSTGPALAAALGDPSAAVREAVVDALVAVGGAGTAVAILPALGSEDPAHRNAACEALRGLGAAAVGPLAAVAVTGDRDVRIFALDVLALIDAPAAGAALVGSLRDPDPNVAAAAAHALGRIGGPEAVPALVAALGPDPWVRCAVATGLGRIGGADATAALVGLLADPDETVGFIAARTLAESAGAPAVPLLVAAVGHAKAAVTAAALEILDEITERLTPPELEWLRSRVELDAVRVARGTDNPIVQLTAARVLDRLNGVGFEVQQFTPPVHVDGAQGGVQ